MAGAVYLTMADLAALYRVSVRTVRQWAHDDQWRRRGSRPKLYHAGDAQASYSKRHHGRTASHLNRRYGEQS